MPKLLNMMTKKRFSMLMLDICLRMDIGAREMVQHIKVLAEQAWQPQSLSPRICRRTELAPKLFSEFYMHSMTLPVTTISKINIKVLRTK